MMWEKLKAGYETHTHTFISPLFFALGWILSCGREGGERDTVMIQMIAHFHVSVPARRDVEIPLHLVPLQAAKDATAPPRATAPAEAGGPLELLPLPPTHLP